MNAANGHLRKLLYQAALVGGAGKRAQKIVDSILLNGFPGLPGRTCIDGGVDLMLVARAPSGRSFDCYSRLPDAPGGVHRWRRERLDNRETWNTRLYLGAPDLAYQEIHHATVRSEVDSEFLQTHRLIGANARLYFLARQCSLESERLWVGWQLDKHCPPVNLLQSCGWSAAWEEISTVLMDLLGRELPRFSRGWAFLAGYGRDDIRIRIGTSLWSRLAESPFKPAQFRATVARLQGDVSFAEALYRVLWSERDEKSPNHPLVSTTGCAVEIEWAPEKKKLEYADFFLRVPSPNQESLGPNLK